jgi:capsid assembly protease
MRPTLLAALAQPWAITKPALQAMTHHALNGTPGDPPSANPERRVMSVRDGVAIIPVNGVLCRASDLDFNYRGYDLATYARIAIDVHAALDSREVHSLLLTFDSPGGQISGMQECALQIRAAAAVKPVWGHIDGEAASAAYGLIAATQRISASPMAMAGSLGAIIGMYDFSEYFKQMGITEYEFISSVSPHKNPDPGTPMGREDYTALVDTFGTVLIEHIASLRAVTSATVLANYGQGRMLIGADALAAGLVDVLSTFDETHAAMVAAQQTSRVGSRGTASPARSAGVTPVRGAGTSAQEQHMKGRMHRSADSAPDAGGGGADSPSPTPTAEALAAHGTQVLAAERTRIGALLDLAPVAIDGTLKSALVDGTSAGDFAVAALKASRTTPPTPTPAEAAAAVAAARERSVQGAAIEAPLPSAGGLTDPTEPTGKDRLLAAAKRRGLALHSPA